MTKRLNIFDVADRAEVSISTVSRVMNNKGYVTQAKRDKVIKVLKKLNFRPNSVARSLVMRKHHTLGVFLHYFGQDYVDLFASRVLAGISERVRQAKNNLLLLWTDERDPETEHINDALRSVDGVLLFDIRYNSQLIKNIRKSGVPCVLINERSDQKMDHYVDVDNFRGGYLAVRHLLDNGHRDICLITGSLTLRSAQDRLAGARAALAEAGVVIPESRIINASYMPETAHLETKKLFSSVRGKLPTAIFAASDLMAMAIIDALKELNLRIPDDVSVVGYDNCLIAPRLNPPLTSVNQPLVDMGRKAVENLFQLVAGQDKKAVYQEILPVELIERKSVKKIE